MAPRRRSDLYRLAVVCGAAGLFFAGLPHLTAGPVDWWLVISLPIVGVLAQMFPLRISLSQKVSVDGAVTFATVLLLPAWWAAAVVGSTQGIGMCVAALRRVKATREKPPLGAIALSALFHGGQLYVASLAPALLLGLAGLVA